LQPWFGTMSVVAARSNLHLALGVAAGASVWTTIKCASHRWVLHGPFSKRCLTYFPQGGLHQAHHRAPANTSLTSCAAGHLAVAAALASIRLGTIASTALARSAAAAFSAGYSTYEISRWSLDHRPAVTLRGEQRRARHHRHHFDAPASNLGVTNNFWDRVFDTDAPNEETAMISPAAFSRVAV
jgi:sterol desaturase/sphingolipid hydroxylase (fatty acid hydroxylase superfamily)